MPYLMQLSIHQQLENDMRLVRTTPHVHLLCTTCNHIKDRGIFLDHERVSFPHHLTARRCVQCSILDSHISHAPHYSDTLAYNNKPVFGCYLCYRVLPLSSRGPKSNKSPIRTWPDVDSKNLLEAFMAVREKANVCKRCALMMIARIVSDEDLKAIRNREVGKLLDCVMQALITQ